MIFDGESLIEFPNITIINETHNFKLENSILNSIYIYNAKELAKNLIGSPVQKMYYLDKDGCITFTSGACVNKFSLGEDVRLLLSSKLVKLFKLLDGKTVTVRVGEDDSNGIKIKKLGLSTNSVEIISIINSDDSMIDMVPKDAIVGMTDDSYPYTVELNKKVLMDTINRLMILMPVSLFNQPYGNFEFHKDHVVIYDRDKHNMEEVKYKTEVELTEEPESLILDLNDLRLAVESVREEYINFNFGNHRAVMIHQNGIYNIIPECVL